MTFNPELEFPDYQAPLDHDSDLTGIWLDEEIIIDILINNPCSYLEDSLQIFDLIKDKKLKGFLTCKGLVDIDKFAKKTKGDINANTITSTLLKYFHIRTSGLEDCLEKCHHKHLEEKISSFNKLVNLNRRINEEVAVIISHNHHFFLGKYPSIIQYLNRHKLVMATPTDFLDWYDIEDKKASLLDYIKDKENHTSLIETIGREYPIKELEALEKELERVDDNLTDEEIPIAEYLYLKNFEVHCCQNHYAKAKVTLHNTKLGKQKSEDAYGKGAIDALCRAFDSVIKSLTQLSSHVLNSISLHSIEEGLESRVSATAILSYQGEIYEGSVTHTDTVKAAFYAYIKAVNNIFKHQAISSREALRSVVATMTQYENGKRDFSNTNLSGKVIKNVNWSQINFRYADLSNAWIISSNLRKSNLYKAQLEGITLDSTNLSNANLEEANLCEAKIEESLLNNANLFCAKMTNITMHKVKLQGAKLNKANLRAANLTETDLREANLDNANLEKANLSMANLNKAILHEAILREAILNRAILNGANLAKANFSKADLSRADLSRANLTEVDLTGADLTGANLTEANLTGVNLTKANLTGANLTKANLTKANLTETDLNGANLTEADLTEVDLSQTRLENANFSKANLSKANLQGVNLDRTLLCRAFLNGATMPDGKVHKGYTALEFEMREVRYYLPTSTNI